MKAGVGCIGFMGFIDKIGLQLWGWFEVRKGKRIKRVIRDQYGIKLGKKISALDIETILNFYISRTISMISTSLSETTLIIIIIHTCSPMPLSLVCLVLLLAAPTLGHPPTPAFTRTQALPLNLSRTGSVTNCGYNLGPIYLGRPLDDPLNIIKLYYLNLQQQHQISPYLFIDCFKYSQQLHENYRYIVLTQYAGSDKTKGNRLYRIRSNKLQRVSLPLIDNADVQRGLVGPNKMGFQIFDSANDSYFYIVDKSNLQVQTKIKIDTGSDEYFFDCYDSIIQKTTANGSLFVTVLYGQHYEHSYRFHVDLPSDVFIINFRDVSICLSTLRRISLQVLYEIETNQKQLRIIDIIYNTKTKTPIDFSVSRAIIYNQWQRIAKICGTHVYMVDLDQQCITQNDTCVIDGLFSASSMLCSYTIDNDQNTTELLEKVQIIFFNKNQNHTNYKQLLIYEGVYKIVDKNKHNWQWVIWVGVLGVLVLIWVLGYVLASRRGVKFADYVRCRCWGRRKGTQLRERKKERGQIDGKERVDLKMSIIEDNEELRQ